MEFNAYDDEGKTVIESEEKQHTVMNLVKHYVWDTDAEAGFDKGHPYIGASKLVVNSDAPRDDLQEAIDAARDELETFRSAFSG
ncbi:MAG: hypothetical protein MUP66_01710 [Candidatus Nanohaloarchaeota archaeon QJJ-5]|nr:hypothetical protein [Candidatus Nanohaloarchaeota archaeon QJJ-5]